VVAFGRIQLDAQVELVAPLNDSLAYRASVLPEPAYGEYDAGDELSSCQSLPLSRVDSQQIRPLVGYVHQREAQGDQQHGRPKALLHPASAVLKIQYDPFSPVCHGALLMASDRKNRPYIDNSAVRLNRT
jgi:hypothetical protein